MLTYSIGMLRPLVACAIAAPKSVTTMLDVDRDEFLSDDDLVVEIISDRKKSDWVMRSLLIVIKNVQFNAPLTDMLGKRSNSEEDVRVIVYQMASEDLNTTTPGDESFLHRYTREERLSVVDALLDAVPRFEKINHVNAQGETALHVACYIGNAYIVKRILECPYFFNHAYLDQCDNTAFHYCIFQDRDNLKQLFAPLITSYSNRFPNPRVSVSVHLNSLEAIARMSSRHTDYSGEGLSVTNASSLSGRQEGEEMSENAKNPMQNESPKSVSKTEHIMPHLPVANLGGRELGTLDLSQVANVEEPPSNPVAVINPENGVDPTTAKTATNNNSTLGSCTIDAIGDNAIFYGGLEERCQNNITQISPINFRTHSPGNHRNIGTPSGASREESNTPSVFMQGSDVINIARFSGQLIIDNILYTSVDGIFQPVGLSEGSKSPSAVANKSASVEVIATELANVSPCHESARGSTCNPTTRPSPFKDRTGYQDREDHPPQVVNTSISRTNAGYLKDFNGACSSSYQFSLFTKEEFDHVMHLSLGDSHERAEDEHTPARSTLMIDEQTPLSSPDNKHGQHMKPRRSDVLTLYDDEHDDGSRIVVHAVDDPNKSRNDRHKTKKSNSLYPSLIGFKEHSLGYILERHKDVALFLFNHTIRASGSLTDFLRNKGLRDMESAIFASNSIQTPISMTSGGV